MQKIWTVGRKGWQIRPEVSAGINKQEPMCELVHVTTEGGNDQENKARNWNKAKKQCTEDIMVKMDADVILQDSDAIKILIDTLIANPNADMTAMPTKPSQQISKWCHSLYAIRREKVTDLPEHRARQTCVTCSAIKDLSIIFIDKLQKEYGK